MPGTTNLRINPELFEKIQIKLGLKKTQVYAKINKYAKDYNLRQHHAAIKLATDSGINIKKYADDNYYAAINGRNTVISNPVTVTQPPDTSLKSRLAKLSYQPLKLDFSKITIQTL